MLVAPALRAMAALAITAIALVLLGAATAFFLGYRVSPVLTGSMTPTFRPGDAVVTRPVAVEALQPGMIPVIVPPGEAGPFAHRIVTVATGAHGLVVTTKGDANPAADPWRAGITARRVPVVVGTVPALGRVLVWIHGRALRAVLLCLVGLLVTGMGTRVAMFGTRSRHLPAAT